MLRLALLISGRGSTAEAVIKASKEGRLEKIEPAVVISSNPLAEGLARAEKLGIPTRIVKRKDFLNSFLFGERLLEIFEEFKIDLISQNGWLVLTPENVVKKYQGKIINQHPGPLDPGRDLDFGGKGMFGARVIGAVLLYSCFSGKRFFTEATTHFVTKDFDKGDLIQAISLEIPFLGKKRIVDFWEDKNLQEKLVCLTKEVQTRLLPLEHKVVIQTIALFAKEKVFGYRRPFSLIPMEDKEYLEKAKKIAMKLFPQG